MISCTTSAGAGTECFSRFASVSSGVCLAVDTVASAMEHDHAESPRSKELPVLRFLAGAAACFLFMTGAFILWQGRAQESVQLPDPPPPRLATPAMVQPAILPQAPEATPKSREQKRFARAD